MCTGRAISFTFFRTFAKFFHPCRHALAAALIYCHETDRCGGSKLDNKTQTIIEKFKKNPAIAQAVLQSGDGQKLMQMLTAQDGGAALEQAAQNAAHGNTKDLAAMLSSLMRSPQGAELMKRLNDAAQK